VVTSTTVRGGAEGDAGDYRFSVVAGGPIYRVARRLSPPFRPFPSVAGAAFATAALAWLPLVVLATVAGQPLVAPVQTTALTDVSIWCRFLLAAPLLVLAERPCGTVLSGVLHQLVATGVVRRDQLSGFHVILDEAARRRDSVVAEVLLIAAAILTARLNQARMARSGSTLMGMDPSTLVHTPAGKWLFWVSIPLLNLLIFRWLWRLVIVTGILRRVAQLDLEIIATHPDHAGGLGFLRFVPAAFNLVALGIGTGFAGALYRGVQLGQLDLNALKIIVPSFVVVVMLIFTAPVLVIVVAFARAKLRGELEYGRVTRSLVAALQQKWMGNSSPTMDEGLEANDFSAAVDLTQLSAFLNEMRLLPIRIPEMLALAAAAGIPSLVVVATIVPVAELLNKIASLLF